MPVLQAKWISCPLSIVKDLFDQHQENGDFNYAVRQFFESKLNVVDGLNSVPFLNTVPLHMLHDGCLVRYRAMVQDQFGPELYLKAYHRTFDDGSEAVHCGLYSDLNVQSSQVNWDHPSNVMANRETFYCVPIPAETPWVKDYVGNDNTSGSSSDQTLDHSCLPHNDMEDDDEGIGGSKPKKHCPQVTEQSVAHDFNFPLPGDCGTPCLVKVYGDWPDVFHVTSIVEVIGVLSVHPSLEAVQDDPLDMPAERKAHSPPPSLVPRLHAIIANDVSACRRLVLQMLTQTLCGDELAAEYTLLHILSSVYGRTEVMALGKYSLNLSHCPNASGVPLSLYQLLVNWLTKCFLLPLNLINVNTWKFTPKKDYDSNRLVSSVLQLSAGTQLVVDETVLTAGQLTQMGVANLAALSNIIQWQKLKYDFQYHTIDFDSDLPVLVLSEGKSMLKTDCHVPLVGQAVAQIPAPSVEAVNMVRRYLTLCRGLSYSLDPQMQTKLAEEFVKLRRQDTTFDGEDFQHLLCTARLVSLSHCSSTLSGDLWTHTCSLEQQRHLRIANCNGV